MSFQAKRELLAQVAGRYRDANGRHKSHILDEFVAITGYARKYAIRLLTQPNLPPVEATDAGARSALWPGSPSGAGSGLGGCQSRCAPSALYPSCPIWSLHWNGMAISA